MAAPDQGAAARPDGSGSPDIMAETGPGLADDAVVDGELAPGELGQGAEEAVDALKRAGWSKPDSAGSVGGG